MRLFLCGDVMTGRGIDQILPAPSRPGIYEPGVRSALRYVELAEEKNGPIPRPTGLRTIWGQASEFWDQHKPKLKIVNLETSITTSNAWLPKGINYRMHPGNIGCLTAAGIDVCVLANNHVLDWGEPGLRETLKVLREARIHLTGAGRNLQEATLPIRINLPGTGQLLVLAYGLESSGIPEAWAATATGPGVSFLADLSPRSVAQIREQVRLARRAHEVVLVSLHWGSNWGYTLSDAERAFAHALIDEADVDLIHGHSSHHPRGIEVYRSKLILYGCGDLINDYEGISGLEVYRSDLVLMYFATLHPITGDLLQLLLVPLKLKQFQLQRPSSADISWLGAVLNREGATLATRFLQVGADTFRLQWSSGQK